MAILNPRGGRSETRSGPDHQLRGQLIFEKIQVWSQNGPTGAAGDVICLSWQAPVAVTSASVIRTLSPSTQDMWAIRQMGSELRQHGPGPARSPRTADLGEEPGGERRPGPAGPTCPAAVPALLGRVADLRGTRGAQRPWSACPSRGGSLQDGRPVPCEQAHRSHGGRDGD